MTADAPVSDTERARRNRAVAANRERRRERRAKGLCSECGQPAVPGKSKCEYHAALSLDSSRHLRGKAVRDWPLAAKVRRFAMLVLTERESPREAFRSAGLHCFGPDGEEDAEEKARRGLCAAPGCRNPRQPGRTLCASCLRRSIKTVRPGGPEYDPEGRTIDLPLDMPPRQCARCEAMFQPTVTRRLLCAACY